LHHWNSKQNIYDSSGKLLPDEKSDKMSTLLWEIMRKDSSTVLNLERQFQREIAFMILQSEG